jgi:Flp pilus assembly protein TadD
LKQYIKNRGSIELRFFINMKFRNSDSDRPNQPAITNASAPQNQAQTAVKLQEQAEDCLRQGQLSEAIAASQQALKIQPNFAAVYKTLGNAVILFFGIWICLLISG